MTDSITISVPATVANVTVGFDILGFALEKPRELFTLNKIAEKTVRIIHRDGFELPVDPKKNISGIVLHKILEEGGFEFGFEFIAEKKIMPGSGLGSSAASAVAPAYAASQLLKTSWNQQTILQFAMSGEQAVSGARHADNIAPCLCGGLVLVRNHETVSIEFLPIPDVLVTVAHPQIEVKTSASRATLPKVYPLGMVTRSTARLGSFVSALYRKNMEDLKRTMIDELAEPHRIQLIPQGDKLLQIIRKEDIIGAGIAGSGPSLFCWSQNMETANTVEGIFQSHFERLSIPVKIYTGHISSEGAKTEIA
jgi:homoserine kinase